MSSSSRILALFFGILHLTGAQSQGIRSHSFPIVISLNTTRQVASHYSSIWDIQKQGSRKLDDDTVQLRVIVQDETELFLLDQLETTGVLTYQRGETIQRNLGGISSELNCYRTVEDTYARMDQLATQYSNFVTVSTIGQSWLKQQGLGGHDIKVIVITSPSNTAVAKDDMVVVGGHHSRELPPPEAILRWAEHLLESYGSNADVTWVLDRTNIHLIPIANPDGREIVQNHLDWDYRKNAHASGCNSDRLDGVDLNRNYPMWWGRDEGSSGIPCSGSYRGKASLSEPESLSVYQYASDVFPAAFKKGRSAEARATEACPDTASGIFIDLHSFGDFVYFPWGYEDVYSPNHQSLLTMAAKLAHPGQYTLWGPGQDGFLYFVSGDATDATYGIDCVASFGFEVGSNWYASCSELESSIVPIMQQSLLYAAKTVSAPYKIPLGPDILAIEVDASDPSNTKLTVHTSDDALIVPGAKFNTAKSHPIAGVKVFVDIHPNDNGAVGLSMQPKDGAFDSVDEIAIHTLDTAGVEILYFQATDSAGHKGPVSAIFADGTGGGEWPSTSPASSGEKACSLLDLLAGWWFN